MNTERTEEPKTECVVYARVARKDGDALKRQVDAATAFAATQGFSVIAVFTDSGSGSSSVAEHPGLTEALKAIDDGTAHALVVRDLGRIAREYATFREIGRRLKEHGATLHVQALGALVDPTDPHAQLLFTLANYERESVRQRMHQRIKRRYLTEREPSA